MTTATLSEAPQYAVPESNLVPVSGFLKELAPIPPSRMFLINKSLKTYRDKYPDSPMFDASQGDGGASLPGVPREILERAAQMEIEHGTAYDMPYGTDAFRKVVVEKYWHLEPDLGMPRLEAALSTAEDLQPNFYKDPGGEGEGGGGDVKFWDNLPHAERHAVMDDPTFLHRGFFNHLTASQILERGVATGGKKGHHRGG